jgi:von Willebrand factor type A domain/Aerotolerance regulator N-terminal
MTTFALLERFTWSGLAKMPPLWAIAAAGAFVLLLYILRLRRRQVEVPFSRLWARVLQDREPTSFWRRLKRILSMLLQIAILALLLGAIADPRDKTELKRGRHILILLDTSASMQAVDATPKKGEEAKGPRSRIQAAKKEIHDLINKKRRNDYVMLVRMDGQVTPVSPWTRDKAELQESLGNIETAETAADIGRGLRFAADTLRGLKDPMLVLVGDGQYDAEHLRCVFWGKKAPANFNCEAPDDATKKPGKRPAAMRPAAMRPAAMRPVARGRRRRPKPMEQPRPMAPRPEVVAAERFIDAIAMGKIDAYAITVGKSSNNVGIIAFNARRNPADKFSHQLFVKVKNYRKTAVRVNLAVSTGAVLPEIVPLEIGPKETKQYIKKGLPAAGKQLIGKLEPSGGGKTLDDFPLDDKAYALLPKRRKSKVLLVSAGNLYIEGTLLLDEENINYQRITPAAWTPSLAKKYDTVIFDDFTPPRLPRTGNFLLFDPRGKESPVEIEKRVKDPEIWWPSSDKDKRHQIMDYIRVKDVRALESSVFKPQKKDIPLIRLDERGPVYALLRKEQGRKIVVVGFSSQQTNWVMRIGFPVFLLNTVAYFAGENTRLISTYRTGETWQIPLEVVQDLVEVVDPKKKKFKAPMKEGKVTFYGRHIGFHTIYAGKHSVQIAANLANPAESDITPSKKIVLGYGRHKKELARPDLKEEVRDRRISTRTVLLTVLLAGIGLVLLGFGLYGGRTGVLWVVLGIGLLATAVIIVAFAAQMRPWTGLLLAVAAMLITEWLTYNRRVTV